MITSMMLTSASVIHTNTVTSFYSGLKYNHSAAANNNCPVGARLMNINIDITNKVQHQYEPMKVN